MDDELGFNVQLATAPEGRRKLFIAARELRRILSLRESVLLLNGPTKAIGSGFSRPSDPNSSNRPPTHCHIAMQPFLAGRLQDFDRCCDRP